MVVATRSSVRLSRRGAAREDDEAIDTSSSYTKRARRCSDQPRAKRRRSSSERSAAAKHSSVGDSEGQNHVELTWQQRDLLQQERPARRASQSKLSHLRSVSLRNALPVNTSEAPQPTSSQRPLPREAATGNSGGRPRRWDSYPSALDSRLHSSESSTASAADLYAAPSCFRAPLPHCLPHPTFSRSTASFRAVAPASA